MYWNASVYWYEVKSEEPKVGEERGRGVLYIFRNWVAILKNNFSIVFSLVCCKKRSNCTDNNNNFESVPIVVFFFFFFQMQARIVDEDNPIQLGT